MVIGIFSKLMNTGGIGDGFIWLSLKLGISRSGFVVFSFLASAMISMGAGAPIAAMFAVIPIFYPPGILLGANPAIDVYKRQVWRDTNWLSHFQFSPDNPSIAMFCHEGPWNCVNQRIWLINMDNGDVWPCFRQGEDDCVGHEFWTGDGMIVFDNRGAGHDGTISSDRTQVFTPPSSGGRQPYFGIADKTGQVQRTVPMPFYCNHYICLLYTSRCV